MALKTFNLDKEIYEKFSKYCRANGISMSKKIENFIRGELAKMNFESASDRAKKDVKTNKEIKTNDEHLMGKYC